MALNAIAVGAGTQVNGRALSLGGAVSLDSNDFYGAPLVVTISGGATAIISDSTPLSAVRRMWWRRGPSR